MYVDIVILLRKQFHITVVGSHIYRQICLVTHVHNNDGYAARYAHIGRAGAGTRAYIDIIDAVAQSFFFAFFGFFAFFTLCGCLRLFLCLGLGLFLCLGLGHDGRQLHAAGGDADAVGHGHIIIGVRYQDAKRYAHAGITLGGAGVRVHAQVLLRAGDHFHRAVGYYAGVQPAAGLAFRDHQAHCRADADTTFAGLCLLRCFGLASFSLAAGKLIARCQYLVQALGRAAFFIFLRRGACFTFGAAFFRLRAVGARLGFRHGLVGRACAYLYILSAADLTVRQSLGIHRHNTDGDGRAYRYLAACRGRVGVYLILTLAAALDGHIATGDDGHILCCLCLRHVGLHLDMGHIQRYYRGYAGTACSARLGGDGGLAQAGGGDAQSLDAFIGEGNVAAQDCFHSVDVHAQCKARAYAHALLIQAFALLTAGVAFCDGVGQVGRGNGDLSCHFQCHAVHIGVGLCVVYVHRDGAAQTEVSGAEAGLGDGGGTGCFGLLFAVFILFLAAAGRADAQAACCQLAACYLRDRFGIHNGYHDTGADGFCTLSCSGSIRHSLECAIFLCRDDGIISQGDTAAGDHDSAAIGIAHSNTQRAYQLAFRSLLFRFCGFIFGLFLLFFLGCFRSFFQLLFYLIGIFFGDGGLFFALFLTFHDQVLQELQNAGDGDLLFFFFVTF